MASHVCTAVLLFASLLSELATAGEPAEAPDAGPPDTASERVVRELEEPSDSEARSPEGLPTLQVTPDFITPGLAFGGYFPLPQMESGVLRVEPFTVRAAMNAGVGYDDNVTLSNTNKVSSTLLTVTPSVVAGLEGATQRYYFVYRGLYNHYFSSSASSYEQHSLGTVAINEWTARLRTTASYDFSRGQDPRGSTAVSAAAPATWNLHRLRGGASYGAAGARGRVDGSVGYTKRNYTSTAPAAGGLDYEQVDVRASLYYRVAPKTSAVVTVSHADILYDENPTLDATENRYLVGVTWDALAATQGRVAVGYLTRDPEDSALPSFSSPIYEAEVSWSPLPYSTVNLLAMRSSAEATEIGSSFVEVSAAVLTWNHRWLERVHSTVRYVHGEQGHQGLGRVDTYNTLSTRLSYAIRRRVRLGAEFRHDNRSSPDPLLEYKRNLTLFTVESSL